MTTRSAEGGGRASARPPALVVIDMQRIFRDPASPWATVGYDAAADRIATLAEAAEGPVVWTRFVRDEAEQGSWRGYYDRWSQCREPADSPAWDLTMPARDGDAVLTLPTFSKWGDELVELTDGRDLVVCGVATDCCVLSTVLGAVDSGTSVTVVTDACAGATEEAHDQAVALMGMLAPMVHLARTAELVGAAALRP